MDANNVSIEERMCIIVDKIYHELHEEEKNPLKMTDQQRRAATKKAIHSEIADRMKFSPLGDFKEPLEDDWFDALLQIETAESVKPVDYKRGEFYSKEELRLLAERKLLAAAMKKGEAEMVYQKALEELEQVTVV